MVQACLNSSNGWSSFCIEVLRRFSDPGSEECLLATAHFLYKSWQRDLAIQGRLSEAELVEDVAFRLEQFVLDPVALEELVWTLDAWLSNRNGFSHRFAGLDDQQLIVGVSNDSEFISSIDKPVCSIEFDYGSVHYWKSSFVVDETCIKQFRDQLFAILSS